HLPEFLPLYNGLWLRAPGARRFAPFAALIKQLVEQVFGRPGIERALTAAFGSMPIHDLPLEDGGKPGTHRRPAGELFARSKAGEQRFLHQVLGILDAADTE